MLTDTIAANELFGSEGSPIRSKVSCFCYVKIMIYIKVFVGLLEILNTKAAQNVLLNYFKWYTYTYIEIYFKNVMYIIKDTEINLKDIRPFLWNYICSWRDAQTVKSLICDMRRNRWISSEFQEYFIFGTGYKDERGVCLFGFLICW